MYKKPKEENMWIEKDNKIINNIIKILFIIACALFAVPSIFYYAKEHTIFQFNNYFQFLLSEQNRTEQTIAYFIILLAMVVLYFLLIKNRKQIFQDTK